VLCVVKRVKVMRPMEKEKTSRMSRLLRLFGRDPGFEYPSHMVEEKKSGASELYPHYDFTNILSNALLEAESQRAKSIMEYEKRRFSR
jgi:hypothetical protein